MIFYETIEGVMQITDEDWYKDGERHRDNGPAAISYEWYEKSIIEKGHMEIIEKSWYENGVRHRNNKPARIEYEYYSCDNINLVSSELWQLNGANPTSGLVYVEYEYYKILSEIKKFIIEKIEYNDNNILMKYGYGSVEAKIIIREGYVPYINNEMRLLCAEAY